MNKSDARSYSLESILLKNNLTLKQKQNLLQVLISQGSIITRFFLSKLNLLVVFRTTFVFQSIMAFVFNFTIRVINFDSRFLSSTFAETSDKIDVNTPTSRLNKTNVELMYQSNRSLNIPPGIPRAFDVFCYPVGREFDELSLPREGAFDHYS